LLPYQVLDKENVVTVYVLRRTCWYSYTHFLFNSW